MADQPVGEVILEAMADGIIIVDSSGLIVFANGRLLELSGYERRELIGQSIEMLVPVGRQRAHVGLRSGYMRAGSGARAMGSGLDIRLRRRDGAIVPVDIALSPVEDGSDARVLASVRDITDRKRIEEELRRAQERLTALLEVAQATIAGAGPEHLLPLVVSWARRLAGTDLAMALLPGGDGGLEVRHVEGENGAEFVGRRLPPAGATAGSGSAEGAVPDLGATLIVPMTARGQSIGALAVANRTKGAPLGAGVADLLPSLAAQAAVAFDYLNLRDDLQRLAVIEDRERIGRELHDGAIQSLFAVGMNLQGATVSTTDDRVRDRIQDAVDSIDGVIRDLRNYIFGLRPALLEERRTAQALRDLAAEFETRSGVVTAVEIETAAADQLGERAAEAVQIAREALSNVERHAQATTCRLSLVLEGEWLLLEVDDDGHGFDAALAREGMGLRNLDDRAAALGGTMEVRSDPAEGTTLRIRLPQRVPA